MPELSKSEIDRLGRRLREQNDHSDADLALLEEFRNSHGAIQDAVIRVLQGLGYDPIGRLAKTTTSIIGKLKRTTIPLSKIQDIAGCRIVVEDLAEQNRATEAVKASFARNRVVDRRANPSYGYRAVHVIVETDGRPVEVQIRTELQQLWARLSEGWATAFDQAIKYGGGPRELQEELLKESELVAWIEQKESILTVEDFGRLTWSDIWREPSAPLPLPTVEAARLMRFKQKLKQRYERAIIE